jgi:hypothetical protein
MVDYETLLNTGVIATGRPSPRRRKDLARRTLIVTGIARSGTSLVATLLKEAGVFMGEFLHDVVNEDAQILELLRHRDTAVLRKLIAARNAEHACWGFKIPNLHVYLTCAELEWFRNPYLIVIYRDPVAVAVRNAISEYFSELDSMVKTANAMHGLAQFVQRVHCPVLLLSYEKALSLPNMVIDRVLEFCDIRLDDAQRARLLLNVQPNRAEYQVAATASFEGRIDGRLRGQLYGWCRQAGRLEPIRLEVFANDRCIETIVADSFREDLADAGVGNGCHGFFVDLARHGVAEDAMIRVKIANRVLELENSGKRLASFAEAFSQ